MKRIVFLIYSLGGGGAERILVEIISKLKNDFKITLVLIVDDLMYEIPNAIDVVYLDRKRKGVKKNNVVKFFDIFILSYKFAKICRNVNCSHTFSLTTRPNLINCLSKVFKNNGKVILYEVSTPSKLYEKGVGSYFIKKIIKYIYPYSNVLLTNSLGSAKDLRLNFHIDKKISVVYSPINIEYIFTKSTEESLAYEFSSRSENTLKFVTVGRLDSGKNHEMMINAFSEMKHYNSVLYILGDGELHKNLQILVKELNMQRRIFFLGFDNNPFKYMSRCDVFLFTSNFEGFPTVVVEALACGLAVISTDCPSGPREILSKGNLNGNILDDIEMAEYGILTPVYNKHLFRKAIDVVSEDFIVRNRYQDKAVQRAVFFSQKKSMQKIRNIIS
jgi:N-acetylgalactosamine-N,N'-diacetylbacillosaminyl-diphospho-undecaprenol 4-alpha-N-acetylgalactosaminyltransferase